MPNILLIEPDQVLADIYSQSMTKAGHKVMVRAGAQTAIMAADELKPDLVIIELQLVEHSGIEFLYEFRSYADWRGIPVIVHSHVPVNEFDGSHDLLKNELGVETYLYKPQTSLRQLIDAIDVQLAAITS